MTGSGSSGILVFSRLSRPPKGWQKRKTEIAKGPNVPKILQEMLAGVAGGDVHLKATYTFLLSFFGVEYPSISRQSGW